MSTTTLKTFKFGWKTPFTAETGLKFGRVCPLDPSIPYVLEQGKETLDAGTTMGDM